MCVPDCEPKCDGKDCGGDGCGGSCGSCPDELLCVGGKCKEPEKCADMVECALDCGFSWGCVYGCFGSGNSASKDLFLTLAWCSIQSCGWNLNAECIQKTFEEGCAGEYEQCMDD